MNARGLTLVEMLVALFILAILAVLSYRTVASMVDTSQHVDASSRRFERLADAVTLISKDISFVMNRTGDLAFRGDGGSKGRPGEVRFTRSGSAYRSGTAAGPVTVGYRLQDGKLEKLIYPPDWMLNNQPEVRPLLSGQVTDLRFRFRDRGGGWHDQWPVETVTGLPSAVEIRLQLADGSQVTRVVAIP